MYLICVGGSYDKLKRIYVLNICKSYDAHRRSSISTYLQRKIPGKILGKFLLRKLKSRPVLIELSNLKPSAFSLQPSPFTLHLNPCRIMESINTKRKELKTRPVSKRYKTEEDDDAESEVKVPITTYMFDCALCMQERTVKADVYESQPHYEKGFCSKECMVGFYSTIGKRAIKRIDKEIALLMEKKQQVNQTVDAALSSHSVLDESKMDETQLFHYKHARDGETLCWGRMSPRYTPEEPGVSEVMPPVLSVFNEFM
jgi:hypothetical protein